MDYYPKQHLMTLSLEELKDLAVRSGVTIDLTYYSREELIEYLSE